MLEKDNKTKGLKFYSQKAIGLATFIGGPLAAGYLIRENYLALSKPDEGRKALIIGIISTIMLFGGIFMIPESIMEKVPNQIIPLIYTAIIYFIVEKIHGDILNKHKELNNEFFSGWRSAGIGFVSLAILLIALFGYVFLSPDGVEYEIYDSQLAEFSKNEAETLVFFDKLETDTNYSLLKELNNNTIPKWEENIEIIKKSNEIENLPSELLEQNVLLLRYSELRLQSFKLYKKTIGEDTEKHYDELNKVNLEIEKILDKINQ